MKKLVLGLICIITMVSCFSQEVKFNDTIVFKDNSEPVICKIQKITETTIFYLSSVGDQSDNINDVKYHSKFIYQDKNINGNINKSLEINSETNNEMTWLKSSPGLELKRAANCASGAIGCYAGGLLIFTLAGVTTTSSGQTSFSSGFYLGSAAILTGVILQVASWIHINRAGRLMLISDKNGIGVAVSIKK